MQEVNCYIEQLIQLCTINLGFILIVFNQFYAEMSKLVSLFLHKLQREVPMYTSAE